MINDNTNASFFTSWSKADLEQECARLNKIMKEVSELAQFDKDDHIRGEADQIRNEEGYASVKEYQEINDLSDEEMERLQDE